MGLELGLGVVVRAMICGMGPRDGLSWGGYGFQLSEGARKQWGRGSEE